MICFFARAPGDQGPNVRSRCQVRAIQLLFFQTSAFALALAYSGSAIGAGPIRDDAKPTQEERFSLHYQATVATQWHPSFPARYSGNNSFESGAESATSVVMDLFAGARLWPGAEVYFQPELAGGRGLSSTLGVADDDVLGFALAAEVLFVELGEIHAGLLSHAGRKRRGASGQNEEVAIRF